MQNSSFAKIYSAKIISIPINSLKINISYICRKNPLYAKLWYARKRALFLLQVLSLYKYDARLRNTHIEECQ